MRPRDPHLSPNSQSSACDTEHPPAGCKAKRRVHLATKAVAIPAVLASEITYQPMGSLRPDPRNARTHSDKQIHQLAQAMRQFGFTVPILIDEAGRILAGHARLAAARRLGLAEVPTLRISGLSEAQRRAYVIADNRLAELAGWDRAMLGSELTDLLDLGFVVELTGFDIPEIDLIIGADGIAPDDLADDAQPEIDPGPRRHQPRRSVVAWRAPAAVRQRPGPAHLCPADGRRTGGAGVHRPAL